MPVRLLIPIVVFVCALPAAAQEKAAVVVEKNVVFGKGGDVELKLDLARPRDGSGPFPAVLFLHGGGFIGGSRQQMAGTLEVMAGRGYFAVSPDYRLAPKHRFPAPIEDCKTAVRFLRANARKYNLDPDRIGVVGFSAGGYLACMAALTTKDDGLEGDGGHAEQSSAVQAVAAFFPPTDLEARDLSEVVLKGNLLPFLGAARADKPELYRKASPVTYVRKTAPPLLLFHGTKDEVVPHAQSKALVEQMQKVGVPATLHTVEGEGHGWQDQKLQRSLEQMVRFLDEAIKR